MDPEQILKGKKILIVDDEKDILDFLTEILDMCEIDMASTFEEAKELLETKIYMWLSWISWESGDMIS